MGDADTVNIQKLIKQVIEATRCSPAQAELALYDNDNNIFAAVEYILDKGVDIQSWTEHKTKKEKKKDEDERRITRGGTHRGGRGGAVDRGGGGRSAVMAEDHQNVRRGGSVSLPRGGVASRGGGPSSRGARGGPSSDLSRMPRDSGRTQPRTGGILKSIDLNGDSSNWKGGSLEFSRSDFVASTCNNGPTVAASNTPSISFAAVAAGATRKVQEKQQPPQPEVPPKSENEPAEPLREPIPETTAIESSSIESVHDTSNYTHEPSVTTSHLDLPENTTPTSLPVGPPVKREEPVNVSSVHNVQPASPQKQTAAEWTTQLKSDLGISPATIKVADVSPVKMPQLPAVNTLPGVEFALGIPTVGSLTDYHFGFLEQLPPPPPAAPVPTRAPSAESPSQSAESLFTTTARHSSPVVAPVKTTSEVHLGNGESTFAKISSPPVSNTALSQPRLGFAETSTVSYSPSTNGPETRTSNVIPKSHGHMNTVQSQTHQQHQPQQMPFQPQIPFSYNPYLYGLSPVTAGNGLRQEDYAATLLQYPFMPGVDMTNLMGGVGFPQTTGGGASQSLTSQQHRSDSHGMVDTMKFAAQAPNRDQQPSAVQPPPGFGTPFAMQPPQMNMHQHYNHQQYGHFMMPTMGGAGGGRQIYQPQDDERKSYEKMGGVKMQSTQPPQYHGHNGGAHYGGGGMGNNKKYNWNS